MADSRNKTVKNTSEFFSILILVLCCLVIFAGFLWFEQNVSDDFQQQQDNNHQQLFNVSYARMTARVETISQQVASLAALPQLSVVLQKNDPALISAQQQFIQKILPHSNKVCLIKADVDQPDPSACIAISFATLDSLRKAKQDGTAPLAVIKVNDETPSLLVAQRIVDSTDHVVGVLLVAFEMSAIASVLNEAAAQNGYFELLQGTKNKTQLLTQGNVQWKQANPLLTRPVPGTYWQLAYWPAPAKTAGYVALVLPIVVIIFVIAMWLLRDVWQRKRIKSDAEVIKQQIDDATHSRLKTAYHVANVFLQTVVDDIQTLVVSSMNSPFPQMKLTPRNTEVVENRETTDKNPVVEPLYADKDADKQAEKLPETEVEKLPEAKASNTIEFNISAAAEQANVMSGSDIDPTIFKAYDIRGIVDETLNEQVMKRVGQAIGSEALDKQQTQLVVARDGRLSSERFAKAVIEGVLASGCDVIDIGQAPTPIAYYAYQELETQSGVVVTGSHNPVNYNGLKLVLAGQPVFGDALQQLYQRILRSDVRQGTGQKTTASVTDSYVEKVTKDIHLNRRISVVIDCSNGVAGHVAEALFSAIGCDVTPLNCDVDGEFPNHPPNPCEPDNLRDLIQVVPHQEAKLGLAFDGDGDRLVAVDAKGRVIWPDRLLVLFAQDVLTRSPGATVIYDVKSTRLLEDTILRAGGKAVMWQSGHSIIKAKMQETGALLGGEMSGHIFFNDRWYGFDDALYSACRLLELLANDPLERTATEVFDAIPERKSTPEILIDLPEGESQRFMRQISEQAHFSGAKLTTIDGVRADYKMGWGLIRASNTMPGLTLRFEADNSDNLRYIQQQFKQQMLQIKPTLHLHF